MKILYDYQAFGMQRYGGVSNCFVKLIENLPKEAKYEIAVRECNNTHLQASQLGSFPPAKVDLDNFISEEYFFGRRTLYNLYSRLFPMLTSQGRNIKRSVEALESGDFDIFHPTFFDSYFLNHLHGKPFVLTVHDMIPERFNWKVDKQMGWKKELVDKAAHIVAVSVQTKRDLMEILGVPESKITVIYHGTQDNGRTNVKPLIDGHYLLYVGHRKESYKNFLPMVRNLVPVLKNHPSLKLVCTGPAFTKNEQGVFRQEQIADRVVHLKPDDEGMRNLYGHAQCFIYPSLYEGFGIPILEAWQAGCPVLLNNKSCFPEIAQDAAVYFQLDESAETLADTVERFLQMSDVEREVLIAKQNERLSSFSWKKSAEELFNVYKSVLDNGRT